MDQARNPLVNESDTTATKSQNNTIYDIAAATNSIEIESSTSRKSSHTNAGSTNGTNAKKARLRKGKWTVRDIFAVKCSVIFLKLDIPIVFSLIHSLNLLRTCTTD